MTTTTQDTRGELLTFPSQDRRQKVLIFIVSYNAEQFIDSVLGRIPDSVWNAEKYDSHVLVIDDSSNDRTFVKVEEYRERHSRKNLTSLYNPKNQGYGGNQKIGFHYAIENGFDAVILLHGDGQYAPELLPEMIEPLVSEKSDVVLGSRMYNKLDALKGKMPIYKWIGNVVLTNLQNLILGSHLSEFHTGYRGYNVAALKSVPFQSNSDYFDFDTDILIQMIQTGKRMQELPIPTYYGDEECRVNGLKYAGLILMACVRSRVQGFGIWYDPKFDYELANNHYTSKFGFASSHQFAIQQCSVGATVVDLGCGPGFIAQALDQKGVKVVSVDQFIQPLAKQHSVRTVEGDLDQFDFDIKEENVETVLALDIIEHLRSPEQFLKGIRRAFGGTSPKVVITTANIGFISVRLGLLLGSFNYGKRGILDLDHKRLFTFSSLERIVLANGFEIEKEEGIPAPFPLALGDNFISRFMLSVNVLLIKIFKSTFSYQMAFIVRPKPTLSHLLEDAKQGREKILSAMKELSSEKSDQVASSKGSTVIEGLRSNG